MSVTQENSDLAGDSTEFADKAIKKGKHQDKLKCGEGKQDGCSNPYQLHSLRWNTEKIIVDGGNVVGSLVTSSTFPWNIAVPPDGTIGVRILANVSVAFQVEQERSVVDSAGIFTLKFGRKKSRRHFHSGGANA